jgi:hypothetical protein
LGLAGRAANLVQLPAAAAAAIAITWHVFKSRHPQRLAILLCASLSARPHVSNYDLILLVIAALLAVQAMTDTARLLALMLPLASWLACLLNSPRVMAV